jgi:very-short-patch-repair endonuclease
VSEAEAILQRITAGQHGTTSRAQLRAAGVSRYLIDGWVRRGRLVALHPGIYRLAEQEPGIRTRAMAAVLAASRGRPARSGTPDVALSHEGAALLWDFPWWELPVRLDVSGTAPRRVANLRVHRVAPLCDDEVTIRHGIPVTTLARTVLDIAGIGSARDAEQALAAAERQSRECRGQVEVLLKRHRSYPGSRALRRLLRRLERSGRPPMFLRSRAEAVAARLFIAAGLPPFLTNTPAAGYEADFLWSDYRVVVEVDGEEFHNSKVAFHRDRARDRARAAAGYQTLRFTWSQLNDEGTACVAAVSVAIGRGMRG